MSSPGAIEPLQVNSLSSALTLLRQVFPWQPLLERADFALRLSLMSGLLPKIVLGFVRVRLVRYWVVWDSGYTKVLGVAGLYQRADSSYWMGWTCVEPSFRGQGLGTRLVDYAIKEVEKLSGSQLWVWTKGDWSCSFYLRRGFTVSRTCAEVVVLQKQL
jgi:GNAT superfamily N-acetyltransferase